MSPAEVSVEHGQVRNDGISLPASALQFLDERSTVLRERYLRSLDEAPMTLSDEEAELRAKVMRRLLDKLGILSEVEELNGIRARPDHRQG